MKKMKNKPGDIQSTIMVAFSVISTLIMVCMGMMVYWKFSGITQQNIVDNNRKMMDQTVDSIENYLVNMRQVSDAAYYDVIHFLRREMLDFTAFPVFFVSNLLLVQRKKYYFNRATVSRNCSIVL